MKNSLILATLLLAAPAAFAQSPTATAQASVILYKAITLSKTTDMNFGVVAAGTTSGTVTLSAAGARTNAGGATPLSGGTVAAAAFAADGQANQTYAITLPASSVTLTSGSDTMTLTGFTSSIGATGTLSSGGTQSFSVGSTLNVGANQAAGTYTGNFSVMVAYN
ncbi:MAG TPA: DUF4402 domain-containing protein [Holophaga sp.]|nr:DUF4402 domain-containing protein [Holophaga sp.]